MNQLHTEHDRTAALIDQTMAIILSEPWVHYPEEDTITISGPGYTYRVGNTETRLRYFLDQLRASQPTRRPSQSRIKNQIQRGQNKRGRANALARLEKENIICQ